MKLVDLRTERRQFTQSCAAASVIRYEDRQEWIRVLDEGVARAHWTIEGSSNLSEFGGMIDLLLHEYAQAYPDTKEDTWL